MYDIFPKLLEYGLPGFSIVLLILGYNLLNKTHTLLLDERASSANGGTELRVRYLQEISKNARIFMGVSLLFFVGGLAIAVISPANTINLSIAPAEGVLPTVRLQERDVPLDHRGTTVLDIENDNVLRIMNNSLYSRLIDAEHERDLLKGQLADVILSVESDSSEVGF
ncbi:hypothetical protein ACUN9Y_10735 [Halomonas sp. V046]|uniref:hypothetical protein n=1 Tax=Halomonas sp. V046 TaxID=3459611 RepID=UPI004043A980